MRAYILAEKDRIITLVTLISLVSLVLSMCVVITLGKLVGLGTVYDTLKLLFSIFTRITMVNLTFTVLYLVDDNGNI